MRDCFLHLLTIDRSMTQIAAPIAGNIPPFTSVEAGRQESLFVRHTSFPLRPCLLKGLLLSEGDQEDPKTLRPRWQTMAQRICDVALAKPLPCTRRNLDSPVSMQEVPDKFVPSRPLRPSNGNLHADK